MLTLSEVRPPRNRILGDQVGGLLNCLNKGVKTRLTLLAVTLLNVRLAEIPVIIASKQDIGHEDAPYSISRETQMAATELEARPPFRYVLHLCSPTRTPTVAP